MIYNMIGKSALHCRKGYSRFVTVAEWHRKELIVHLQHSPVLHWRL
jgi:hypothetical protein